MPHMFHPLILASGSVSRSAMLRAVGLGFETHPAQVDEAALKLTMLHLPPAAKAAELAKAKASEVSAIFPDAYIIGADQICALGTTIFDKPGSGEQAAQHLRMLSGQQHQQHSGVVIFYNGQCVWEHVDTADLTMRPLSDAEIEAYIALDKPYNACGAYHFESHGGHLFSHVAGSSHTIQGLPLLPLLSALRDLGVYGLVKP